MALKPINTPITSQQNVTTTGTPVNLTTQSLPLDTTVIIKAKPANTGNITVGYSSATALNSGTGHFKLAANEAVELAVSNLNQIWIDATVSGEGVEILIG